MDLRLIKFLFFGENDAASVKRFQKVKMYLTVALMLSFCCSAVPVYANGMEQTEGNTQENTEAAQEQEPQGIPLGEGWVLNGSFSKETGMSALYAITLTERQSITVYGTQLPQVEGDYVALTLYDESMGYVTHQSSISQGTTFRWRTEKIAPGNYYILVSGRGTMDYTISYSSSPYPLAVSLARKQVLSGVLKGSSDEQYYRIEVSKKMGVTFTCKKPKGTKVSLELFYGDGRYCDHMGVLREDAVITWDTNELEPGTYFLNVSGFSEQTSYKISWQMTGPAAVSNLRVTKNSAKAMTLKWSRVSNASKYIVYKKSGKKFKTYKTVKGTSCKVKGLKQGTKYTFKVVPVRVYGSDKILGTGRELEAGTVPGRVTDLDISFLYSGTLNGVAVNYYTVKWKKVKGASGYQVFGKMSGNGSWKELGSTTGSNSTIIYVVKGFSADIKVRASVWCSSSTYVGEFSKVRTTVNR